MSYTTCKICGTRPRVGGALGPGSSGLEIYCDICGISVRDRTSTEGAWSKWEALMGTTPVYVVGQVRAIVPPVKGYDLAQPQLWELAGVFNTHDSAVSACRDRTYFVAGPITVGELAPHETTPDWWPSFYPIAPTAEDPLVPGEDEEAARLSQGAPDSIRDLMRNQQTPSAEDRALIANNMEFLVGQGAQGEAVAWRSKSYDPIFNGGYAWAFTCDPGSVTPSHEPLYTHPAERAAVPCPHCHNGKQGYMECYSCDGSGKLPATSKPPEGATVSIGLESAARQAYAHWAEFGPTPEFGELMDHLGEALDMLDSEVINRPGYDSLWSYFGLSYASFLVLPRAFMHAMPGDWQGAMARLLRQWDSTWNWPDDMPQPIVQFRDHGGYVRTPSWLINYRHPETKTIEALRVKPKKG